MFMWGSLRLAPINSPAAVLHGDVQILVIEINCDCLVSASVGLLELSLVYIITAHTCAEYKLSVLFGGPILASTCLPNLVLLGGLFLARGNTFSCQNRSRGTDFGETDFG